MSKKLDPIISEFETQEDAEAYDKWFRAKVQASLDNPGKLIPHDEVMAEMDRIISQAEARHRKKVPDGTHYSMVRWCPKRSRTDHRLHL